MWRGVDVLRPIAWLYAVYSVLVRREDIARPWLAWAVLGVLGAWTVGMVLYRARNTRVVGIELVLACAAILSTRLVDTPEVIVGGAKTVPGFWPAAAVVAWAVLKGWRGGMLAAVVVGVADLLEVGVATQWNGYGYQTWLIRKGTPMFALMGLRGQAVYVDPVSKLVIVHTAVYGVDGSERRAQFEYLFGTLKTLSAQ